MSSGPDERDVAALTELLDMTSGFSSNEQRARYLLTSNWFVRDGVAAATRAAIADAQFWAARNCAVSEFRVASVPSDRDAS